jgi:hypothetical protein
VDREVRGDTSGAYGVGGSVVLSGHSVWGPF